ncbi:MAG TPA: DUF3883 domain-containing protein [Verrucomicrobiae bacterium]|nr:DUF3883 domain-containing protein [Verrucomicrobiae bacterium]
MSVKPNDLANACALFPSLRAGRFLSHELEGHVQKRLTLDSRSNANEIISACVSCGLIAPTSLHYSLTGRGKELSKLQGEPGPILTLGAKEFFVKQIFLNLEAGDWCCRDFILMFRVDTVRGTFVYDRKDRESSEVLERMKLLNSVGFLDVTLQIAIVRPEYLGFLNEFLRQARTPASVPAPPRNSQSNQIGDLAEEKAMEYEKNRLITAGYPELAYLVQRISLVDQSAGYDIVSCRGSGKKPEEKIFVEVKGTQTSATCFIWTRNERVVAEINRKQYCIYVFTHIDLVEKTAQGPFCFKDPIVTLPKRGFQFDPIDVYVYKKK